MIEHFPGDVILVRGVGKVSDTIMSAQRILGQGEPKYSHAILCYAPNVFVHSDGRGVHVDTYFDLFTSEDITPNQPPPYKISSMCAYRHTLLEAELRHDQNRSAQIQQRLEHYLGQAYNSKSRTRRVSRQPALSRVVSSRRLKSAEITSAKYNSAPAGFAGAVWFFLKNALKKSDTTSYCSELVAKLYEDLTLPISNGCGFPLPPQPRWVFPIHLQMLEKVVGWRDVTSQYVSAFGAGSPEAYAHTEKRRKELEAVLKTAPAAMATAIPAALDLMEKMPVDHSLEDAKEAAELIRDELLSRCEAVLAAARVVTETA